MIVKTAVFFLEFLNFLEVPEAVRLGFMFFKK